MDSELSKLRNTLLSTEGLRASKAISGHQSYSQPLNCLSMNVAYWLPGNRVISTLRHKPHSWSFYSLLLCILITSTSTTNAQPTAQVISISPFIIPLQGSTIINATGIGFTSVSYPKCQLQTDNGVLAVEDNTVINDTRMQCVLPFIPLLYQQSITQNNNIAEFQIIDGVNGLLLLSFFDLDVISVSSIAPNWTYISSNNVEITILGVEFVETYEITCHSSLFEVKAIFVNATQLMCLFPTIDITTKINIDVYSVGQPLSVVEQQTTDMITFTYFATPPKVLFFKFNPSYTLVLLQFDREVELGNETHFNNANSLSCEIIFDSLEIFGTPIPQCHWQNTQQQQIIIQLNSNSSVQPNTSVSLKNDIIRTRHVAYSKHSSGTLTVKDNETPLYPIAVIEGPQIIPFCGTFTLNGFKSYNSGSRPLQYLWNVGVTDIIIDSSESGEDDGIHTLNEINSLIPNDLINESAIILSADLFYENIDYLFSLTVTNFLGHVDRKELLMTKANLPALNAWIIGNSSRFGNPALPFYAEATTNVPDCLTSNTEVKYEWTLFKNDLTISLGGTVTTNRYIQLKTFTFEYNSSYVLSLHASMNATTSSANITIDSIPFSTRASIFGGSTTVYGIDDTIILVETGSNSDVVTDQLFMVLWTCMTESEQMPCINSTNNLELVLQTGFEATIHPGLLSPSIYIITVHLLYANKLVSFDEQVIHVHNSTNGPKVFIEEPLNIDRINIHDNVVINGIVQSALPGKVKWTSVYKSGYAYLALSDDTINTPLILPITTDSQLAQTTEDYPLLFTSNITQSPFANPVALYIRSDSLLPNNRYCFRLSISTTTDNIRYSEIEIQTATHPSSGNVLITPSNGIAMQTMFHITAVYWTDNSNDFPLYYRLGFKAMACDSTMWLTSRTEENSFITILPNGGIMNGLLTVVLEVSDAYNATTIVLRDIEVVQTDMVDLVYIHNKIKDMASKEGNVKEAFSYLVATLFSIDYDHAVSFHGMTKTDFKLSMTELIVELYYKNAFQPNVWLHEILIAVLKSITSDISISNANIISLLEIIEEIIQHKVLFWDMPNGGEDVVSVYGNLLKLSSQIDNDNSRVLSDIVTKSFNDMYKLIGGSVCQRMALFTSSQYIINSDLGSMKLYNSLFLSTINLTCDKSQNNSCPFTDEEQSFVFMSKNLLEAFAAFTCQDGVNINRCSSYCIIALQLLNDIHWKGSPYASIVKSYPISLHVISTNNDMEINDDVLVQLINYSIPLRYERSVKGILKCVYWNKDFNEWDDKDCIIIEEISVDASVIIHCSCKHLSTQIAIIDICEPGYYGLNCDKVCPYGMYGEECSQVCECSDMGRCSPYNGSCDCSPGWTSRTCDTVCSTGWWGKDCLQECQCQNDGLCNSINGECDCPPGWIGKYCDTECPLGFYGDNCTSACSCRSYTECDFIAGNCSCEEGYTGITCHSPCEDGYYGNNCNSLCTCEGNGTESCDNVNGTCLCLSMWSGEDCEIPRAPPYSPTVTPVIAPSPFPIWIAATPAGVGLLLTLIIVLIIIILVCITYKKHKQKSAVFPLEQEEKGRLDSQSQSESKNASLSLLDEEGDDLELTRAESRTVLIPQGKILSDLFSSGNSSEGFREPEQIGTKRRWQIIQLLASTGPSITHSPITEQLKTKQFKEEIMEGDKLKVESGIEVESLDSYESDSNVQKNQTPGSIQSDRFQEIIFRKGIYLDNNATLKDLRNGFIDSFQLDAGNRFFQFLNSDLPGDSIPIDNEEEILLLKLEPNLLTPKTIYIEPVCSSNVAIELCICGKFAELECMECKAKGYCSEKCQQANWLKHISICRIVSARRRHAKKMKKKRKKLEKIMKRTGYTPHPDQCMCGSDAVYECSECGRQGYCSQRCQEEDWELHQLFCTNDHGNIKEEDEENCEDTNL